MLFCQCNLFNIDDGKNKDDTVYVAGYISFTNSFGTEFQFPTIWKNGEPTILETNTGHANLIYVAGNDVYVVGRGNVVYYENDILNVKPVAKIWKNGVGSVLFDTTTYSEAKSVFVSGTDVYVCGHVFPNLDGNSVATVWKNGIATYLTDGSYYAVANSVFVLNGDVYVAGYQRSSQYNVAKLWKNGIETDLTDGTIEDAEAKSVFVTNGNDVYVAGYSEMAGQNWTHNDYVKLWKNGIVNNLSDGTLNNAALSLFVVDRNIYVAGVEYNSSQISVAKIWINGVATDLSDGTQYAVANSIYVSNDDVYIAGWVSDTIMHANVAKVWKNGNVVELNDETIIKTSGGASLDLSEGRISSYGNSVFVAN